MDCRPFCFCMNANNNTYSCVRTINSTHNFLYCEFTTGMVTFYNLRIDPFELQNRIDSLKAEERSYLHDQLAKLVSCKGKSCTVTHSNHIRPKQRTNMLPLHNLGQYYRKRNTKTKKKILLAARSLALIQEYPYRKEYSLNTKSWRRRTLWRPSAQSYGQARHERKRRKQQHQHQTAGNPKESW
ncbi:unnamed protein product [Callosobruchus maculatus]|uniref:Sulfatase N-terminal domain-containing protein n=1 Tax=Callosobruchus maculatus TaxID=64391 RepID=A0A653DL98_CALMS|nr:unnamed protein product [Callosobruchus maculatus]